MLSVVLCSFVAIALAGRHASFYRKVEKLTNDVKHPITLFVKLDANAATTCPTLLNDVADPDSPNFNKLWKFEDMHKFSNPEAFAATKAWLLSAGFESSQLHSAPNLEFISVDATVGQIEKVFAVQLHKYVHNDNSDVVVHAPETDFTLPSELAAVVDSINGLKPLPYYRRGQKPQFVESQRKRQGSGVSTPSLLWAYYGVNNRTVATTKAVQQIFASLGQSFSPADLVTWQQAQSLPASVVSKVIGPNQPSACSQNPNNCVEANLDVQQITSTAQLTQTHFWSVPQSIQDIFLYWAQGMVADKHAPLVNSISYGSLGPEDPQNDMKRFNIEACKLGLRGITVVVASGDDGVANFDARNDPSQCGFTPSYPATSPYVTAVGATQGPESKQPEIMCSSSTGGGITSGGGFSDFFSMPSYQSTLVQNYLSNSNANVPPSSQFNAQGRAYPDVAMEGHNFPIVVGGSTYEGSGTSASAPLFASLITLVNGLRLAQGKNPIGFLNPTLYKIAADAKNYAAMFNDVTSGTNNCCAGQQGSAVCCQYGFTCTAGWDPATGVGSPRFGALSDYLANQLP